MRLGSCDHLHNLNGSGGQTAIQYTYHNILMARACQQLLALVRLACREGVSDVDVVWLGPGAGRGGLMMVSSIQNSVFVVKNTRSTRFTDLDAVDLLADDEART